MVAISVSGLSKSFGNVNVFDGLDLTIQDGSYVCLLGPSGCGKTTLMRIISGLEEANSGTIRFGSEDVGTLTSARRDVGMAFQNYALYPHLTVAQNLEFPLKSPMRRSEWPAQRVRERISEIADLLQITPLLDRNINQLSGGQQQRVSLGRSLVRHPKVLLLDEPLTHLDARLRYAMRSELKRIHKIMKTTTIHVTHDQQEAVAIADELVVMRGGRIEQAAPAMSVYSDPDTSFVASFIGDPPRTLLNVQVTQAGDRLAAQLDDGTVLRLPDGLQAAQKGSTPDRLTLALPASSFSLSDPSQDSDAVEGTVRAHEMIDDAQRIVIEVSGQRIHLHTDRPQKVANGDRLSVHTDTSGAMLFDHSTGRRLATN